MKIPASQAATVAFLGRVTGCRPHETPTSLVFAGTDTVLKLRKAVRLGFIDQSQAGMRERFGRRELELNAPHAPELYRGLRAVVARGDGSLALADAPASGSKESGGTTTNGDTTTGGGTTVDWVVEMAPVPKDDFLDAIAERGALDAPLLDAIADAVAAFHARLPPVRRDQASAMRAIAGGNAASAGAAGLDAGDVARWHSAILAALEARAPWLLAREEAGFVRRTHGDLHLGNLCRWRGAPVPFDALEFDEDLAVTDVAYDLAFLLMDIEFRCGRGAANRLFNRYVARTGDAGLVGGLPPFVSMRALVRAHVEAATGHPEVARRYAELARSALEPSKPVVMAIGGLPGTGKSTYARLLAPGIGPRPGALILRSDEIRKRLGGVAPEQRLPKSAYRAAASRQVSGTLAEHVREAAGLGHAVIADATFLDAGDRTAVEAAASGTAFAGFWLEAPLEELARRVAGRQGDASDADVGVLHRIAASRGDAAPPGWTRIDAGDRERALAKIKDALNHATGAC